MTNQSARIELPEGGSVLLELLPTSRPAPNDDDGAVPFGLGQDRIDATLEDLKKSISSAMLVVAEIRSAFEESLPDADEAEISFGLSFEGKLDAKIVSLTGTATFGVKVTLKRER